MRISYKPFQKLRKEFCYDIEHLENREKQKKQNISYCWDLTQTLKTPTPEIREGREELVSCTRRAETIYRPLTVFGTMSATRKTRLRALPNPRVLGKQGQAGLGPLPVWWGNREKGYAECCGGCTSEDSIGRHICKAPFAVSGNVHRFQGLGHEHFLGGIILSITLCLPFGGQ